MSQATSSRNRCYLGPAWPGKPYEVYNTDPRFKRFIATKDMYALPDDFYFPNDMSVVDTLSRIEAEDTSNPPIPPGSLIASARNTIVEIKERSATAWSLEHLEIIANDTMDKIFQDPPAKAFDLIASLATNKPKTSMDAHHWHNGPPDNRGSLVFETVDRKPVLVQEWRESCCEPGCPEPMFRNGQRTAFNERGEWRHPSHTQIGVSDGPLGDFTDKCTFALCGQPFAQSPLLATNVFGRYPVHAYVTEDGALTTCDSPSMREDLE